MAIWQNQDLGVHYLICLYRNSWASDNAGFAHAAVVAPVRSHDSAVPHATAATREPHPGKTDCNTDAADGKAGRAAHTPLADKPANTCLGEVEENAQIGQTQVGPRELLLPQLKPRRRSRPFHEEDVPSHW
jgi:hypothetical protein